MARKWGLGFVADPLPEHERQAGRLSIPYITPGGVVDIKFRCVAEHDCKEHGHAKYDNETGSTARLYGVRNQSLDSSVIAVCEGEFDTIVCTEIAGIPAFGISGAGKWKSHWGLCFEGYGQVFVFADGDDAGKKMAENVKAHLYNSTVTVKPLPPGEDVNSFVLKYGPAAFRERAGI